MRMKGAMERAELEHGDVSYVQRNYIVFGRNERDRGKIRWN